MRIMRRRIWCTYPMTPMLALMRDSLRLWSLAIMLRSWKTELTKGFRGSAAAR